MATQANGGVSQPVIFTTDSPYVLPSQKFMIPSTWKRFQLSQLINKALDLPKPIPFDFIVRGEVLRTSLGEWCAERGAGEEETLEIEYIQSVLPPEKMSALPHEDWVSSVLCQLPDYLWTASYDGYLRAFDYSQKLVHTTLLHGGPITSICAVPQIEADAVSHVIASASHDLTGRLTRVTPSLGETQNLASLHLHTAPVSSISANASGSHVITSSWDSLIGLWDTIIPENDEVLVDAEVEERKKRRKMSDDSTRGKRKAPVSVLKSHTARVSKVVFGNTAENSQRAYSCGFDSTVRTWDVESGVCTYTISASEKPFLDLALTSEGHTVVTASTDRTVTIFDLRSSTSPISTIGSLGHPATPSCVATASSAGASHQVVVGAYDGIVRLWDLRSMKSAMVSFKAWDGHQKVLSVDWARGLIGVGGEGGMEIWRLDESNVKIT